MSDEYWDQSEEEEEEEVYDLDNSEYSTFIRVNGSNISVDPGDNFKEVVKSVAVDAGLGKFRVMLNGDEIKPSQSPDLFAEGDKVELVQYDVAG